MLACMLMGSCAYVLYDVLCFQPALADLRGALLAAPAEDRDPPGLAAELIRFTARGDTVPYATRLLLRREDVGKARRSSIAWPLRYTLGCWLMALHTSERERVAIIASFAGTGPQRFGLVETSAELFGRLPSALSGREMAVVALLIEAPSLGARALSGGDRLLAHYQAAVRAGAWQADVSAIAAPQALAHP